jgi:hypothetical protein
MNHTTAPVPASGDAIDQKVRAAVGRTTATLSVASLPPAVADWAVSLETTNEEWVPASHALLARR